jgi:hypothetical protein
MALCIFRLSRYFSDFHQGLKFVMRKLVPTEGIQFNYFQSCQSDDGSIKLKRLDLSSVAALFGGPRGVIFKAIFIQLPQFCFIFSTKVELIISSAQLIVSAALHPSHELFITYTCSAFLVTVRFDNSKSIEFGFVQCLVWIFLCFAIEPFYLLCLSINLFKCEMERGA